MKHTLNLKQSHPFANCPPLAELSAENILCNNVTLPLEFNPHNVRLWVVGNVFGAIVAVWADCAQDAIDEAIDSGKAGGILIEEADADEETARGGNASEPYDGETTWLAEVSIDPAKDWQLLCKFAEARGQGADNLDF